MLTKRTLIALAALALATPAFAQAPPVKVRLTTAQGDIVIALSDKAPVTTANFLTYVDKKLYDGARFYRASRPPAAAGSDTGLIQGGLNNDPAKVLPPIAHESTAQTGLTNTNAAISMARWAPGTAQAEWFISIGDQHYLDADPADPAKAGFAVFGYVVEGMDVVKTILAAPVSPTAGEGSMKGEMLENPVVITKARREP